MLAGTICPTARILAIGVRIGAMAGAGDDARKRNDLAAGSEIPAHPCRQTQRQDLPNPSRRPRCSRHDPFVGCEKWSAVGFGDGYRSCGSVDVSP
jgi:hypothetical protein